MNKTLLSATSGFNVKKTSLQLLVTSLFVFTSLQLQAAEVEKDFYLNAEVIHLSNPNFALNDKSPVTVFKIAPEFNFTVASELNKYYLKTLLSIYRNSNEDVLPNRENPTVTLGWERTLATGLFGIEAFYNEDVALTQLLATTGSSVGNNIENQIKTKSIAAKWDHDFNSKVSMKNKVSYADYTYSEDTLTLIDYTLAEAVSRVIYHNTETLSTYGQLGFLQFDPDSDVSTSKISRARLGVIANPIDGLDIDANAGFYKATGPSSFSGVEAEVLGLYTRDRMIYNFSINRLVTASGLSQFQKNRSYVLGAKYLLSDVNSVGAEYSNAFNKAPENSLISTADVRTKTLAAFYEHVFKDWTVRANAKYIDLDNGVSRHANEIGVSVIYGPLRF